MDKNTFGTSAEVKGTFNVKTFNTYFTTEDEESILINSDFLLQNASLQTYLESKNKLGDKAYTVPAAFTTTSRTRNKPFAFGGLDQTISTITAVLVTNTNYELDFGLSILRDSAFSNFPIVPFEKFPYGEYFGVKPTSRPYKYREFCSTCLNKGYIESVSASKLSDRAGRKIQKDLKVGFVDFDIVSVRSPRAVTVPAPGPIGDTFESCIEPTPSSSPTFSPPATATATADDYFCLSVTPSDPESQQLFGGTYYEAQGADIALAKSELENRLPTFSNGEPGSKIVSYHNEIWNNFKGGIVSGHLGISIFNVTVQRLTDSGENDGNEKRIWLFAIRNIAEEKLETLESSETQGQLWDAFFVEANFFNFDLSGACPTPTSTISHSATESPTEISTPSFTVIPGDEFGLCNTPSHTLSTQPTPSITASGTPGDEFDVCPTSSVTPTIPNTPSATASLDPVVTASATASPTPTATGTPTPTPTQTECVVTVKYNITLPGQPANGNLMTHTFTTTGNAAATTWDDCAFGSSATNTSTWGVYNGTIETTTSGPFPLTLSHTYLSPYTSSTGQPSNCFQVVWEIPEIVNCQVTTE